MHAENLYRAYLAARDECNRIDDAIGSARRSEDNETADMLAILLRDAQDACCDAWGAYLAAGGPHFRSL